MDVLEVRTTAQCALTLEQEGLEVPVGHKLEHQDLLHELHCRRVLRAEAKQADDVGVMEDGHCVNL